MAMDEQTIRAYDKDAIKIAALFDELEPTELYKLMQRYFIPQGKAADIGCGTGRDCNWLRQQGHEVIGYDASTNMLDEAKNRHPQILFTQERLPHLSSIKDYAFDNVLCSAVIMHLPRKEIGPALKNLLRILKKDGIALLSFRGTNNQNDREYAKLYTHITPKEIINIFSSTQAVLLYNGKHEEQSRSFVWHSLILKKT